MTIKNLKSNSKSQKRQVKRKLLIPIALVVVGALGAFIITGGNKNSLAPLAIPDSVKRCHLVTECQLKAGDILIKRKITNRTFFIPQIFSTYYTHSALYAGESIVIEAQGFEREDANEIIITNINNTEWIDPSNDSWLIFRSTVPTYSIIEKASSIAIDDSYVFGYGRSISSHKQYCSGFIANLLVDGQLINLPQNALITPDLLAKILANSPNFTLIAASQ